MIPIHLYLSGFLSYREPVELDFRQFDLACIAGANGAGKSSLLDAITWVLFGEARKKDDSIINARCNAAEVALTFDYEGNVYRVQRMKARGKTGQLEFQILQSQNGREAWKTLSERSTRETDTRIEQTLRMDYETFVNAAFFLQGKADQFTQQAAGNRKKILSSILGLEIWEMYRQRASERRKSVETEIAALDGRLHEIAQELSEEGARKERLSRIEAELERLSRERLAQESALENIRRVAATLAMQEEAVAALGRQLDTAARRLNDLQARLISRRTERAAYAQKLAQAESIRAAYTAWQQARHSLEQWDEIGRTFREQEKRREGPRDEINAARTRLLQEQTALRQRQREVETVMVEHERVAQEFQLAQAQVEQLESQIGRRAALEAERSTVLEKLANLKAENQRLHTEMQAIKNRQTRLDQIEGLECPVCGQPLPPEARAVRIAELQTEGVQMGQTYRENQKVIKDQELSSAALAQELEHMTQAETRLRTLTGQVAHCSSRLQVLDAALIQWQQEGQPRLMEVSAQLEAERYAPEAQQLLAEIDASLKAIGYDAAAHDAARRLEQQGRSSEKDLRDLEKAEATLAPLERELAELEAQEKAQAGELTHQQQEYDHAAASLAAAQAQAPDLNMAERRLMDLQEQENRLRFELGAARQKVDVLQDLKARRRSLETQREEQARLVGQYKQLEQSFGKNGVPALLIEQALPEIEAKSNEILERLSGGNMSVRFVTQQAYKDKKREDLKETLDILISDGIGTRDYEMFSGGEAFRVNFAIRLALSEVLARRAGARLQTLVIDEGFGSQDAQGRQRLIEAINLVRPDFAKILVITHIDELKEAFPTRIEVEKSDQGSQVRVL